MDGDRLARERARARLANLSVEAAGPGRAPVGPVRPASSGAAPTPSGGSSPQSSTGWVPQAPGQGQDAAVPDDRATDPHPSASRPTGRGPSQVERDGDAAASIRQRAFASALTAYSAAHGHPLDHPPAALEPVGRRWATRGRVALAAAAVLALLCAGVVARAVVETPSASVQRPGPDGSVGADDGGQGGVAEESGAESRATEDASDGGAEPGLAQAAGGAGDGSATAEPAGVVVHVVGQVAAPGLVTLPSGARVADAIAAAGGASSEADLAALNLARVLMDGEQVVVPRPGEVQPAPVAAGAGAPGASGPGAEGLPVDLNRADLAALDGLPGIGPVLAQRILDWRDDHGAFTAVDELREVTGIGPAVFEGVRDLVRV